MAAYHEELLEAARLLIVREPGQRGRLPGARVRRSISTSYYALFHVLSGEVGSKIVGSQGSLRVRRRLLSRSITHRGARTTLDKIHGADINASVRSFFPPDVSVAPRFARNIARAFLDAQAKRESADYDLNEPLSETDARVLRARVRRVIRAWRDATSPDDRDFKHALALLILLKGQLRQEN